jgi:hypothetical protein
MAVSAGLVSRGGEETEIYLPDDESGFTKGEGGSAEASLIAKIARDGFKEGFGADSRGNIEA